MKVWHCGHSHPDDAIYEAMELGVLAKNGPDEGIRSDI
jgi:hypothetical protein